MQEIIINASATAAKEVIFATFDTSNSAAVVTSLSVGDLLWRIPNSTFATAAGTVSLLGSNVYHYLPTQAEVSVPGRAALTFSKAGFQRAYELIEIKGPALPTAPIYSDAIVSATGTRIPFRLYDSYTRLPASGVTFTSAEVWLSPNLTSYVTAGGSVTALGNGDYAYIVSTADVCLTGSNLLQIRKAGFHSEGAVFNVYTSLALSETTLNVNVVSVRPGAIGVSAITSAAYEQAADSLLNRRIKPGASGTRTVSQALATLRNAVIRTETGYTVYDVDDTSIVFAGSLATSLSSSPITMMTPTT